MILELIQNAAMLVALAVGLPPLARRLERRGPVYRATAGALFGAVCVVGMMTPLRLAPGVIYDARSVVLALAGLFGGPLAAAIAAAMAGAYRLHLGGAGALPGVLVILEAAALGVLLHHLRRRDERWVSWPRLWLVGVVVHALMLALQLLLPDGAGWRVLRQVGPAVMGFFPLGFLLVAQVFLEWERRAGTERALAASHALLENLAGLVPGVIYQYRLDPDGRSRFPYASPGMLDIYEVSPADVQEDATPVFGRLHPEDHERVAAAILDSARTLETFTCEFRVVLPRQGLRWRWSQAHPERTADGGTLWHGIIVDVTARKDAELAQERLEEQYRQAQKMEAVGRLAGGVAHDFNNMLQTILGYSELLLGGPGLDAGARENLEQIRRAGVRSADLTRQLLAFARRQTASPRVLDLDEAVADLLKMLRRLIGEDIDLDWRPCAGGCPVRIDPAQVDQVLANLVVNARDAITGVGRIVIATARAELTAADCRDRPEGRPGTYAVLTVTDDGAGMDRDTLERACEPFFTTKDPDKGTGLGLATVYGIVQQNGGFIDLESRPGRGTTVRIHLPVAVGTAAERPRAAGAAAPATGHETVLLVEDEPALLELSRRVLARLGYRVLPAAGPGQALEAAGRHDGAIDLLITDVVMPQMNGRDLYEALVARRPGLRCLFMSGYTADIIADQGVLDEGIHFLQKPFATEDLARKLREVLAADPSSGGPPRPRAGERSAP